MKQNIINLVLLVCLLLSIESKHTLKGHLKKRDHQVEEGEATNNQHMTYGLSSTSDNNYSALNKHIDEAEHQTENEILNQGKASTNLATGVTQSDDKVMDDIANEQELGINDVMRDQYEKGII